MLNKLRVNSSYSIFLTSFALSVVLMSNAAAQVDAQSSARPARPLRIAYLSTSATMASVWMAKETGALAKQGLDTEVISMPSSSAIPALIANEIDVVQVSAAPVITASVRGLDVVFVAGLLNTMIWDFYVRPEIKTIEQAKSLAPTGRRPRSPTAHWSLSRNWV